MATETIISFSYHFIDNLLRAIQLIIFIVIILSWFQVEKNKFTIFLNDIASPILNIAKKVTPKLGMIDLSPIVAILGIDLLRWLLVLSLKT